MRGVEITPKYTVAREGGNATTLRLYSHAGTHMDAPVHFEAGPETIDQLSPSRCMGLAWVVNLVGIAPRALIGIANLGRAQREHAHRIGHEMADALRAGDVVAIFPEGTTTDGTRVLPFHASLLQPAIATGALVQPGAIRFLRSDGTVCTEVAYDGDRTLAETVRYPFAGHPVHAHVHFLEPIPAATLSRRALAAAAAGAIASSLGLPAPDRESRRSPGPRGASQ